MTRNKQTRVRKERECVGRVSFPFDWILACLLDCRRLFVCLYLRVMGCVGWDVGRLFDS